MVCLSNIILFLYIYFIYLLYIYVSICRTEIVGLLCAKFFPWSYGIRGVGAL